MYNELRKPSPIPVVVFCDEALAVYGTVTLTADGLYSGAINTSADVGIEEYIAGDWRRVRDVNNFDVYMARANQSRIRNYTATAYGLVVFRGAIDGKCRGFRVLRKIYEGTLGAYETYVIPEGGLFMIKAVCPYGIAVDYYHSIRDAWWESFSLTTVYWGYVTVGYAVAPPNRARVRNKSDIPQHVEINVLGWV